MSRSAAFARQADRARLLSELDAAYPSRHDDPLDAEGDAPAMQADTPAAEADTPDVRADTTPAQPGTTDEAATPAAEPDATAAPRRS